MSIISNDVLKKVNSLRNDNDNIYTFVMYDTGQEFHIITPEQLNLIMNEQAKMIRDEILKKKRNKG